MHQKIDLKCLVSFTQRKFIVGAMLNRVITKWVFETTPRFIASLNDLHAKQSKPSKSVPKKTWS
jgi:hypothetical protein